MADAREGDAYASEAVTPQRQPLAGVRVIDLSTGVPGGYLTKLLAGYGADVIKVEPPGGDPLRLEVVVAGDVPDPETGPLHLHLNTNKRSIMADLDTTSGCDLVRSLAATAEVVIDSSPPGWMAERGLDHDHLSELRPGLVTASVTPFGSTGPFAGAPSADIVTYAMGGPMSTTGIDVREPLKLAGWLSSYQVGNVAAPAILGALTHAEQSGESVHVELSELEAQVASIDRRVTYLVYFAMTGSVPDRLPAGTMSVVPRGVYPCADGYVMVSGNPQWRHRMAAALGDVELGRRLTSADWLDDDEIGDDLLAALYGFLATRTKAEASEDAQAHGWPITPLNAPIELLDDPQFVEREFFQLVDHPSAGEFRQPGAPFRMAEGWKLHRPAPLLDQHREEILAELPAPTKPVARDLTPSDRFGGAGSLPLAGVRVLDLTVVWAGPYATMLLADMGAEVIRFDNPWIFPASSRGQFPRPEASLAPQLGPLGGCYPDFVPGERPWNQHGLYAAHARNKKSATIDLRTPLGRNTFLRLVDSADVLVENNRADLLDNLGLGWDVLHARNPRLVLARMPSMGIVGPKSQWTGFGVNFEAACALSPLRGYRDLDPTSLSLTYHMDAASGPAGALAVQLALRRRETTGVGEVVEVAQSENMMQHIGEYLIDADRTGRTHTPIGNRHATRAPQGCYPCEGHDVWVVISIGSDDQWRSLTEALDRPEWASDQRFATAAGRQQHHDEVDELIGAVTARFAPWEVFRRCKLAGVPSSPVLDEAGCYANPQLLAREFFRSQGSDDIGVYPFPNHQWRWTAPPMRYEPIARMGRDNDYVYRELLGMSTTEYAALDADGHLSLDYLQPNGQPF